MHILTEKGENNHGHNDQATLSHFFSYFWCKIVIFFLELSKGTYSSITAMVFSVNFTLYDIAVNVKDVDTQILNINQTFLL